MTISSVSSASSNINIAQIKQSAPAQAGTKANDGDSDDGGAKVQPSVNLSGQAIGTNISVKA
jgi:hypothetical protein